MLVSVVLYVSLPGYFTFNVFSPTGMSTGTFTVPFSLVFPFTSVPFGNVTIIVALGIGSLVIGSTNVTFTVVFPSVVFVIWAVMLVSRLVTVISPIGYSLSV